MPKKARIQRDKKHSSPAGLKRFPAPPLPYRPVDPKRFRPRIGIIGCGAITHTHCMAYTIAGYEVVALCDINRESAMKRKRDWFPKAKVYTHHRDLLVHADVDVVDITPHPKERVELIEDALRAGKHVLSQKPFVLDLKEGERLAGIADMMGVKLAVNQNGRWSPHFNYMRQAVRAGLLGDVVSVHAHNHWDHNWTASTPFNEVRHLILYDYAIHWFDILCCFMGEKMPKTVFASNAYAPNQLSTPPMLGQVHLVYEGAQASLVFDASTLYGKHEVTSVTGTQGSVVHLDIDGKSTVTLYNEEGYARPRLFGTWFPDGFHGSMAELLCAIEEDRQPTHSARNNLKSLAVCFAAVASAETGKPVKPFKIQKMPGT